MSIASRAAMRGYKQPNQSTPVALRRGFFRSYLHISKNCELVTNEDGSRTCIVRKHGGITYKLVKRVTA